MEICIFGYGIFGWSKLEIIDNNLYENYIYCNENTKVKKNWANFFQELQRKKVL